MDVYLPIALSSFRTPLSRVDLLLGVAVVSAELYIVKIMAAIATDDIYGVHLIDIGGDDDDDAHISRLMHDRYFIQHIVYCIRT